MKIVILPGLNGTDDFLGPFCSELHGVEVEVIEYPDEVVSYEDAVIHVRSRLPNAPHILLAESFSGPVAGRIAADPPQSLRAVIYIASFLRKPRHVPAFMVMLLYLLPMRSGLGLRVADWLTMGRWSRSDFVISFRALLRKMPRKTIIDRLRAVLSLPDELPTTDLPTMYLRPRQDRLIPKQVLQDFTRVKELDGPHFLLQACPKEAATAIREALPGLSER